MKCECGGELIRLDGQLICKRCGLTYGSQISFTSQFYADYNFGNAPISQPKPRLVLLASERLELPQKIRDLAIQLFNLYKAHHKIRNLTGKSVGLAAASILLASRLMGVPVQFKQVVKALERHHPQGLKMRTIMKYMTSLESLINKKARASVRDHIPLILSRMNLGEETRTLITTKAIDMLNTLYSNGGKYALMSKDPVSNAAALIYIASSFSDEPITQKSIARAANRSPTIVRLRSRELRGLLGLDEDLNSKDRRGPA
ncbi:MAG: hypothetical protein DRO00_06125 [Thermoproteota archaeon]|nr:MAG: hypothetical protein DRO00_06125 [Candidatus Korarchaeota archaeon]